MKKFFYKILLSVIVPISMLSIVEIIVPSTVFTHRMWEALTFQTIAPHHTFFFPNIHAQMLATGDLCHHTPHAVTKNEVWITDKLGFRNNNFIEQPDVLLIGDSYIGGCSLSQNDMLSNQIICNTNNAISVYNMAPCTLSKFDFFLKIQKIQKPKIIIYSIVERNIPEPLKLYKNSKIQNLKNKIITICETGEVNIIGEKAFKFSSIQWLKARLMNSHGMGYQSPIDTNLFFLRGATQTQHSDQDLHSALKTIVSYKNYCDSLGITFIFMPMPDKETVYYSFVPLPQQPQYLFTLDSLLRQSNVLTINTLALYNEYNKTHKEYLYHLDDTHWNKTATELVSKQIIKTISTTLPITSPSIKNF